VPAHFPSGIYAPLLPSSGFAGQDDIRSYLLQFYTGEWIDVLFSMEFAPFAEYDGILFINSARAGFSRPNWQTATHALVFQEGNKSIVKTTLYHGAWHRLPYGESAYPFEMTHRFTLINGRIDSGIGFDPSVYISPSGWYIVERETRSVNFNVPSVTSANVRVQIEKSSSWGGLPDHVLFDLSQVETYYEFSELEGLMRFVFSTDIAVANFRLLRIYHNENFFRESAELHERLYNVQEILYTLEELTPEMPFVVAWWFPGGAVAGNGFSFTDAYGQTRYFAFFNSGYEGDDHPIAILEF